MSGGTELRVHVPRHMRGDDREVIPVQELDFRRGRRRGLLVPGLLVGFVAKYHWHIAKVGFRETTYSERSRRLALVGEYTGERREVSVPRHKYRPQGPHSTHLAPVFEVRLLTDGRRRPEVGRVAIARFQEGSSLFGETIDHTAIQQELGAAAASNFPPYLGILFTGSLYYASPVQPGIENVVPSL